MNIFASSFSPSESAQNLDDKRVVKMILESSQMLSTARPHTIGALKPSFKNHPANKWVQSSPHNFAWLWCHLTALLGEYTFRYGRHHNLSYIPEILIPEFHAEPWAASPHCKLTRDVSRGLDYTHVEDVYESYRRYLRAKWITDRRPVYFTRRGAPWWR